MIALINIARMGFLWQKKCQNQKNFPERMPEISKNLINALCVIASSKFEMKNCLEQIKIETNLK